MCSVGPRSLDGTEYIPVTFNVTAEEYLLLLKKKNGKTWNELFLGKIDDENKCFRSISMPATAGVKKEENKDDEKK